MIENREKRLGIKKEVLSDLIGLMGRISSGKMKKPEPPKKVEEAPKEEPKKELESEDKEEMLAKLKDLYSGIKD